MQNQSYKPSLKRNAIFNIIYQFFQIGIPIILIPILSGRLKTDGNGNYAFLHSIVLYFSYFALLGVNYYGTRTIAEIKAKGILEVKQTFWLIFFAKAITSIIAILGYLVFCLVYHQDTFVLFTQLFFLFANLLDVTWYFSGDENFKSLCLRNVFVKSLSLIFIILFVREQKDIGIYSLILGLAEVTNQFFMWFLLIKKKIFAKENFGTVSKKGILTSLKGMAVFFIPQLLIELYTILNVTFLGLVWGNSGSYGEVGVFDYANKIVSVITTITVSLGMVFLARLSLLNGEHKENEIRDKIHESLYYSLFIAVPLVVGIIGTGHSFIQWFLNGDDWSKVGTLLFFLPVKVLFVAVSNTLGVQFLISKGRIKQFILSVGIGAVVCLLLNFILVKPFGSIGSSIAVVVAEACVTIAQCIMVRKDINIFIPLKRLWKTYIAAIVMAGFIIISYIFFYKSYVMFGASFINSTKLILAFADLLIIISSALVYFGVLIILKEGIIIVHLIRKIKIIKPNNDVYAGIGLILVVFAIVLSFGFYKPYLIKFENSFAIEKRCAAVSYDSSRNNSISHRDDITSESPIVSIKEDELHDAFENLNKTKDNGFIYNANGSNSINMISYRFYFFQCQDYGTFYNVNLRYCLKKTNFIKNNLNDINIRINVFSKAYANEPSTDITINNRDNLLSNYFANDRRDFISYNDTTKLWEDTNFECSKGDKKSHRDSYYCVVSLYFLSDVKKTICDSAKDAEIKQEVWLLNG